MNRHNVKILLYITFIIVTHYNTLSFSTDLVQNNIQPSSNVDLSWSKWTKNISGSFRNYTTNGKDIKRFVNELQLNHFIKFNTNHTYKFQGKYIKHNISTKVSRYGYINLNSGDPRFVSFEKEKRIQINKFKIDELLIESKLGKSATLSIGQQTIVWGQFDIFSPVDLLLPFEFSSSSLGLSKIDNRLPQPTAKLSIYPKESVEIEAYYFPKLIIDDLNKSLLDEPIIHNSLNLAENNYTETLVHSSKQNSNIEQYALRVLYYPNWGTIGITFYDGWWQFAEMHYSNVHFQDSRNKRSYSSDLFYGLKRRQAWGIEVAKPIGNTIYKLEAVYVDGYRRLYTLDDSYDKNSDLFQDHILPYQNWVENKNQSKTFIKSKMTMISTGFDANWDNWTVNANIGKIFFLTNSSEKEGIGLSKSIENVLEAEPYWMDKYEITGSINIMKYLADDYTKKAGIAAGMLGNGAGVSIYYTNEIFESFTICLSYQYLALLSQLNSKTILTEDGLKEEEKSIIEPTIAVGFNYLF